MSRPCQSADKLKIRGRNPPYFFTYRNPNEWQCLTTFLCRGLGKWTIGNHKNGFANDRLRCVGGVEFRLVMYVLFGSGFHRIRTSPTKLNLIIIYFIYVTFNRKTWITIANCSRLMQKPIYIYVQGSKVYTSSLFHGNYRQFLFGNLYCSAHWSPCKFPTASSHSSPQHFEFIRNSNTKLQHGKTTNWTPHKCYYLAHRSTQPLYFGKFLLK